MLKRIRNEKHKTNELEKIRKSYDEKMLKIRLASFEREKAMEEVY